MKCISIFKCNPQIEIIDKSHCSLEDVPNFQNYSRSLEELFLDFNKLTVLNENVFRLTNLRRLSFSENEIRDIPPDIAKLVNLVELDCHKNRIQVIPEQIKFLRGLQICDFSGNDIEYLPSGLVQLKNLACLCLNTCLIRSLPEDFGLLKNLESLELRENEFESLPASVTGLESLKKLDIGQNSITELPEDIGRLTNLEYLLLDDNKLESIPTKIGRLDKLQCLDLSRCELEYLPEEISGLVSLTDLHLSENRLMLLPDGIRNLKNLTILKIDNNFLRELNANIGGCVSLQELVITSNHISELPASIGNLTDLRALNADSNQIRELPATIGNLRHLGILSLRDNHLTHLPVEIGQLDMAKVINVANNRLQYLPVSITALNLKALWLSKNQAQPLPKLQIDELPDSETRVLTCYLLPQQQELDESMQEDQVDDNNIDYANRRTAAVSFDTAAVDDLEIDCDGNFVRHDTPHPRELRARHQRFLNNASNAAAAGLMGHDNASFSLADTNPQTHEREYDDQQQEPNNIAHSYHQPLEYDSNGLPEVPFQAQEQRLPIQTGKVAAMVREVNSRTPEHHQVEYDNNGDSEQENRPPQNWTKANGIDSWGKLNQKESIRSYNNNNDYRHESESYPNPRTYVMDICVRLVTSGSNPKKHKPGLGLSIAGGKDTPPYKDNDEGIFVSKVTKDGPAEAAGVKVGDKILAVNNNTFYEGITHQKAVDIFKKIKPDCAEFTLKIIRDPDFRPAEQEKLEEENSIKADSVVTTSSRLIDKTTTTSNSTFTRTYTIPVKTEMNGTGTMNNLRQFLTTKEPEKTQKSNASTLPPGMSLMDNSLNKNIIYTTLVKDYRHDLGLVLENRTEEMDSRSSWSNIIISDIKPNSIASRDGKLQVNDRLLSINGTDVTGVDLDRIMLMLEGTDRFIRIVVSRGENDDPIGEALKNMPIRPPLGSWYSSTNMSHRPSLIESYQRPTFGSVSSLQKQPQLLGTKPPKPPKPTHLLAKEDSEEQSVSSQYEDNPIARPRGFKGGAGAQSTGSYLTQVSDAEKRAAWRRERLKSIEDDVEMAKLIAEAQRRRREEK